MRNYDWCNERFRNRKPRSSNCFRDQWDIIEYDREKDRFELRNNGIFMNRDGSFTVEGVDAQLRRPWNQGWISRVFLYTGIWLNYPKDRKLHAYVNAGKFVCGDFTVTKDREIICKARLQRWEPDPSIAHKKRKAEKLLKLAAKFTERDPKWNYWIEREEVKRNWWNEKIPLATRVKWWVNMPSWVLDYPGRGKFQNIRSGHWRLRPVPKAKQQSA